MREARVRLIYPSTIRQDEVQAALRGVASFSRFGVLSDSYQLTGARKTDKEGLKGVRNAGMIRNLVSSERPVVQDFDFGSTWDILCNNGIIPLGVMPAPLQKRFVRQYSSEMKPRFGTASALEGALVSVFTARQYADNHAGDPEAALISVKAIEAVVMHELGHAFGQMEHCRNRCMMQDDTLGVIRGLMKDGLDFCGHCQSTISRTISQWRYGH